MVDSVYTAALLALLVSALFGVSSHVQRIALDHMDSRSGTFVNIATTSALLWLLSPLFLEVESLATRSAGLFALTGLIVPALSISLATLSVSIIGPAISSGLASMSPLFAMTIAVVLLGEVITGQIMVGTLIVVTGVLLIALRSRQVAVSWPLWAITLPIMAAFARGITHPILKLGLLDLPSPMTAILIASSVSVITLFTINGAMRHRMPAWNAGYYWFALCGIINGTGMVGLSIALELGEVVVVSPIVSTAPVFTLLSGYIYFKRESIGWPTVGAIGLIFSGCLLIMLR